MYSRIYGHMVMELVLLGKQGISHGPPVFMVMERVPLGKQGITHGPSLFMVMELVPLGNIVYN